MKHEREIPHYEDALEGLAGKVGRLTYDRTEDFVRALAQDLSDQSEADSARGRVKLSTELAKAAALLQAANQHIAEAWRISAPYMTPEERGETRH